MTFTSIRVWLGEIRADSALLDFPTEAPPLTNMPLSIDHLAALPHPPITSPEPCRYPVAVTETPTAARLWIAFPTRPANPRRIEPCPGGSDVMIPVGSPWPRVRVGSE